jgi:hypothetical protein
MEKNVWSNTAGRLRVETQNKRGTGKCNQSKADGEWRLKTKEELENAIRYENIVRQMGNGDSKQMRNWKMQSDMKI